MTSPKSRLTEAVIDHVATHGIGDLSLRALAAAIGTSHRMLIYHFGSKEGLLVEVVRVVEDRQRAVLAELADTPGASLAQISRAFWQRLSDPASWPIERLIFEIYGQALQGRPGTVELLGWILSSWLEPLTAMLVRLGTPPADATARARLALAVYQGLLLDLLTTGDRSGVDEAMELFVRIYAEA